MPTDLDVILDPGYLGDLRARSMDEIRAMRAECQEVETGLSLLRRLVQGRLDIVGIEISRRAEGGDPADLPGLIEQLPDVLAARTRAPGRGRLPQLMSPAELPAELAGELQGIVKARDLADLPSVEDGTLRTIAGYLGDLERRVSDHRKALFDRIDALQAEITRRYKDGEASVDTLLR